jgi:hypothetical protein
MAERAAIVIAYFFSRCQFSRCCSTARACTRREREVVFALQDVWGSYTETPVF